MWVSHSSNAARVSSSDVPIERSPFGFGQSVLRVSGRKEGMFERPRWTGCTLCLGWALLMELMAHIWPGEKSRAHATLCAGNDRQTMSRVSPRRARSIWPSFAFPGGQERLWHRSLSSQDLSGHHSLVGVGRHSTDCLVALSAFGRSRTVERASIC